MGHGRRPRIALFVPYSKLWEDTVGYDVQRHRAALADGLAKAVAADADVVASAAIATRDEGAAAGKLASAARAEAVVVAQTMGVQPAFMLSALDELRGLPVVVWWVQRAVELGEDFDHAAIVDEGGAVGTPMLTNVLTRRRMPFQLVVGRSTDRETVAQLVEAIQVGVAASRLSRARGGRVGEPIDGYDCVATKPSVLETLIGTVVEIAPAEIRRSYAMTEPAVVTRMAEDVRVALDVSPNVSGEGFLRSLRLAAAMDDICREFRLDAGAMNCHVPEIRFGEEIGVTPCFALGQLTTRGIPWTCAGDVLTVIPMLALKLLGEACLYHELEAYDQATGEFVVANTGEHDLALAGAGRIQLVRNEWFANDRFCGVCACFQLRPGPAALVGFTEIDGVHRFVVAPGEVTTTSWPKLATVNGSFRFSGGLPSWVRWCEAGVNHHSALTSASAVPKLARMLRLLDVELVEV